MPASVQERGKLAEGGGGVIDEPLSATLDIQPEFVCPAAWRAKSG